MSTRCLPNRRQDRFGVVQRVGLRYVDVVRAQSGKGYRFYLRPGLHGLPDEVYQPGRHLVHIESRGNTVVDGDTGTMVVRVVQNDQGLVLPPDLLAAAPKFSRRVEASELVTLIDIDHYVEGTFNPDSEWVAARGLRDA